MKGAQCQKQVLCTFFFVFRLVCWKYVVYLQRDSEMSRP